jgi:hypothetical protein
MSRQVIPAHLGNPSANVAAHVARVGGSSSKIRLSKLAKTTRSDSGSGESSSL